MSVVCRGRKPMPETNTIGWNGDVADVLWVTRQYDVRPNTPALCISINPKHLGLLYEMMHSGCPGCGRGYDIYNPKVIHHWQQPEGACLEIALKLGAKKIYIPDPTEQVMSIVRDNKEVFAEKGISVEFEVVIDDSQYPNSMEDLTNG